MSIIKKSYDVIISGAGPVGSIAALALSKTPYIQNILIIEKYKPKLALTQIPNQRVYSINPASLRIMQSLGVFPDQSRRGIINRIKVFKEKSNISFEQAFMSQVIENDSILTATNQQIQMQQKITTIYNDQIDTFNVNSRNVQVKLKSGENVLSKLLVGSDGNKSKVKQLSKIRSYGWSYNQMGIVCTLKLQKGINTAFQKYYGKNVLAVLPLWDNYASIVWSAQKPLYNYLIKLDNEVLKKQLESNIGQYNIKIESILNKPLAFPLSTLQSERYISQRIALIGDAAHSIHPMAGLGVNSGFADAAILANNIIKNAKTGNDIGQQIALKGYQNEAKKLNYTNSVLMQFIKKGFQIQNPLLNLVREQTINLLDKSDTLKKMFVEGAKTNPFSPTVFEWQL